MHVKLSVLLVFIITALIAGTCFSSENEIDEKLRDLKNRVIVEAYLKKKIDENAKVTDAEIKAYYRENTKEFEHDDNTRASIVVVEDLDSAKEILQQIRVKKVTFEELARQKSTDVSSENDGDLGWYAEGTINPEIEAAAANLEQIGDISKIIKTESGFTIIKLTGRRTAGVSEYDEVKKMIQEKLEGTKKQQVFQKFKENLRSRHSISIHDEVIKRLLEENFNTKNNYEVAVIDNNLKITTDSVIKEIKALPPDLKKMAEKLSGVKEVVDTMAIRELILAEASKEGIKSTIISDKTVNELDTKDNITIVPKFETKVRPDSFAIVIGIEKYKKLPTSAYSVKDAELMNEYFKALGIPERNINYLIDDNASLSEIKAAFESWLPNQVKKGKSQVFIYYSGHGAPDPSTGDAFIVPYDSNPDYISVSGYSLKGLYERLGELRAANIIVILDSCFSGAGGRSVMAKNARPLVMMTEKKDVPGNITVLSASKANQITTSSPKKEHGVFTWHLLRALKAGKMDVVDIYEYLKIGVEDEARTLNVQQSPDITPAVDKLNGKFTFM